MWPPGRMNQNLSDGGHTGRPREQVLALAAAILVEILGIFTCYFLIAAQSPGENNEPIEEFGISTAAVICLTLLLLERARCVYHSRAKEELPGRTCKHVEGCSGKHKISIAAFMCGSLFGMLSQILGGMRRAWEKKFLYSEKSGEERELPWYITAEVMFATISLSFFVAFPCFFCLQWYDLENLMRTIRLKPERSILEPEVEMGKT